MLSLSSNRTPGTEPIGAWGAWCHALPVQPLAATSEGLLGTSGLGQARPRCLSQHVALVAVEPVQFLTISLSPLPQVLVLRNIAGLYQAFLLFVWGTLKYSLRFFLFSCIHSYFRLFLLMSNVHMTCVWFFLTLFFRGNFEDKLLDIYFFFSNLLSLESKGKNDLFLHWLYLYVTNKRYFVQLLG